MKPIASNHIKNLSNSQIGVFKDPKTPQIGGF